MKRIIIAELLIQITAKEERAHDTGGIVMLNSNTFEQHEPILAHIWPSVLSLLLLGTLPSGSDLDQLSLSFCLIALLYRQVTCQDSIGPIAGFIRTNLVGHPVIHDRKIWLFDPDVSLKRRKTYIELHGDKGEKLIERLGLGIDGMDEKRLIAQRQRDEGHLGGLNSFLP